MKAGILLLIIFVLLFSCRKDKPFMNDGVITGFDGGQIPCVAGCICSGGLFFHLTNTGDITGKKLYNPGIFKLPSNPHFPDIDLASQSASIAERILAKWSMSH